MDNSQDLCDTEINGDASRERLLEHCTSSISSDSRHRLFDSQSSICQIRGGGKAADVILWKHQSLSLGIIIVATFAWLLYERSGLSFLSISSDILFILIIIQFIWANSAAFLNKQLRPLPELVLSEEMVNNAAASFRVKINYFLLMAHDISLGKDFRLFFKVVVILWLLSVIGTYVSFFTLVYIGTIISITVPALCGKYKEGVDKCTGSVHNRISKHCSIVDANAMGRIPEGFSKNKAV